VEFPDFTPPTRDTMTDDRIPLEQIHFNPGYIHKRRSSYGILRA
jgi:hypothetical protein